MICPQCHKQIADTSDTCQFCGHRIDHRAQLPKEIKRRRYQRWFFYGLISLMFIGMIATIAKLYSTNNQILVVYQKQGKELAETKEGLDQKAGELATTSARLSEIEAEYDKVQKEISAKADAYKEILSEKNKLEERYQAERNAKTDIEKGVKECERKLNQTDAMIYAMMVQLGMGISNDNLMKIMVADANLGGTDADGDGLSDLIETALGTDKAKKDTDGDTFSDKDEVLGGFNPGGAGSLKFDQKFADSKKGLILLQVERNGEAWYVNPKDGKRYFLGRPGDALKVLAQIK